MKERKVVLVFSTQRINFRTPGSRAGRVLLLESGLLLHCNRFLSLGLPQEIQIAGSIRAADKEGHAFFVF
jgi:hypothetical protein